LRNPEQLKFTQSHEWIDGEGTVGISDHAQKEITDVVFVELPKKDQTVTQKGSCAVVESVKAAFDIYAPVSGTIESVNDAVINNPAIVNQSFYGDGWLFKIKISDPSERDKLMSHEQYQEFLKTATTH